MYNLTTHKLAKRKKMDNAVENIYWTLQKSSSAHLILRSRSTTSAYTSHCNQTAQNPNKTQTPSRDTIHAYNDM